jgi:hypothetical protein
MTQHKSDSSEQRNAEAYILGAIAERFGLVFDQHASLGIGVEPDGIDVGGKVVVEIYARVGALKGAQLHKVKGDLLKLAFIEKRLGPGWRKIICFGCPDAAKFLMGKSWPAAAARQFGIEVIIEPLPSELCEVIKSAQKRQRMINAD